MTQIYSTAVDRLDLVVDNSTRDTVIHFWSRLIDLSYDSPQEKASSWTSFSHPGENSQPCATPFRPDGIQALDARARQDMT